jgi:uncharacterized protein (UPF0262 family)
LALTPCREFVKNISIWGNEYDSSHKAFDRHQDLVKKINLICNVYYRSIFNTVNVQIQTRSALLKSYFSRRIKNQSKIECLVMTRKDTFNQDTSVGKNYLVYRPTFTLVFFT